MVRTSEKIEKLSKNWEKSELSHSQYWQCPWDAADYQR